MYAANANTAVCLLVDATQVSASSVSTITWLAVETQLRVKLGSLPTADLSSYYFRCV